MWVTLLAVRLRTMVGTAGSVLAFVALTAPARATTGVSSGTVRVPEVRGERVVRAYRRLHRAGFKVSIPKGFELDTLTASVAVVQHMYPSAGRRLRDGSFVRLRVGCECAIGSPAVPVGTLPRYSVPDFDGRTIGAVRRWIARKALFVTEHIGPLRAGNADSLYENYRIARQHPRPGTALSLGIVVHDVPGTPGFRSTPLVVWAHQPPPPQPRSRPMDASRTPRRSRRRTLTAIGQSPFELGAVTDGKSYAIFADWSDDFQELLDNGSRRTIAPPVPSVVARGCSITGAGWGVAVSYGCADTAYLLDLANGTWRPLAYTFPADGGFGPVGRYWLETTDCEFAPGNQTCPPAYLNWHNGRQVVSTIDGPEANIDSPTLSGTYAATHLHAVIRDSVAGAGRSIIGYQAPGKPVVPIEPITGDIYGFASSAGSVVWADRRGVHAYVLRTKRLVNFAFEIPRSGREHGVELSATSRYLYLSVPQPNATMTATGSIIYRGRLPQQA